MARFIAVVVVLLYCCLLGIQADPVVPVNLGYFNIDHIEFTIVSGTFEVFANANKTPIVRVCYGSPHDNVCNHTRVAPTPNGSKFEWNQRVVLASPKLAPKEIFPESRKIWLYVGRHNQSFDALSIMSWDHTEELEPYKDFRAHFPVASYSRDMREYEDAREHTSDVGRFLRNSIGKLTYRIKYKFSVLSAASKPVNPRAFKIDRVEVILMNVTNRDLINATSTRVCYTYEDTELACNQTAAPIHQNKSFFKWDPQPAVVALNDAAVAFSNKSDPENFGLSIKFFENDNKVSAYGGSLYIDFRRSFPVANYTPAMTSFEVRPTYPDSQFRYKYHFSPLSNE